MFRNVPVAEVFNLANHVEYQPGQIVSRALAQHESGNVTLFAFAAGEGLTTHTSTGDALVYLLDGRGQVTIDGQEMTLSPGESVVMPAHTPHAVYAPEDFKMLLIISKGKDA
ncbi:MAG: cupin domain-containing protein [Caldilineaceae bacterium]|nr:cupin domain-containing protein [Caldilineaceae bacterium]MCB9138567.1 cupin domain-containing protein [Caldilineaceae bacterium]